MAFYFVQFVTGLASACSLFLVASGLSIIFGVTRVVNFAHGAFYMLGAYIGDTLVVEDLALLIWGPSDLLGPRAPGFKGAIDLFGQPFPTYDLLLIALGPLTLIIVQVLLRRTHWGVLVRAATQDREMVAALGVNQQWLF